MATPLGLWRLSFAALAALGVALAAACSSTSSDGKGSVTFTDGGANPDANGEGGAGGTCAPGDVATFQPTAYHPATPPVPGACTTQQIGAFFQACFAIGSTKATCDAFRGSDAALLDKACAQCILTSDVADKYGPLILHQSTGLVSVNLAGCIETLDPANVNCAKAFQAADQCDYAACKDNCALDNGFSSFDACLHQAASNGCKTWTTAAACSDAEAQPGAPAAKCFVGATFQDYYNALVPIFCGGGDAG